MKYPKRSQYKHAKSQYRLRNWSEYEAGLQRRGDLTVWLSDAALGDWRAPASGKPGGQRTYADIAIEAALTIRMVFHLPLLQTEGFLRCLAELLEVDLPSPNHTTLSRRLKGAAGEIVASDLTAHRTHDCAQVPALLEQIADSVATVTADGAYDTKAVYEAAHERGEGRAVRVLIPPGRPDRGHRCRSRAVATALPRRFGGSSRRIRVEIRLENDTLLLTHLDEPQGVHHE